MAFSDIESESTTSRTYSNTLYLGSSQLGGPVESRTVRTRSSRRPGVDAQSERHRKGRLRDLASKRTATARTPQSFPLIRASIRLPIWNASRCRNNPFDYGTMNICSQNVATRRARTQRGKKNPPSDRGFCVGDPNRIRTGVTAVRGQRTRPLYDGAVTTTLRVCHTARRPAKQRPRAPAHEPGLPAGFTTESGSVTDSSPLRAASTPKMSAITPPSSMMPAPR